MKQTLTMEEPVVDEEYLKEMTMARRELGAFITNNKRAPLMLQLSYVTLPTTFISLYISRSSPLIIRILVCLNDIYKIGFA